VWLAVAFALAFGATPAQAGAGRLMRERQQTLPGTIDVVLQNASARLFCASLSLEPRTTELDVDGKPLSEARASSATG
jgi:hypothetical protein